MKIQFLPRPRFVMERRCASWLLPTLQFLLVAGLLVGGTGVRTATAIEFDRRGETTLDGDYAEGFEEDLVNEEYFSDAPEYEDEHALQGERSLVVGGGTERIYLTPRRSQFEGRRVNVRLWYRADGTDLSARLFWANETLDAHGAEGLTALGSANLHPTGRATSDGWVEVETGPIDWEFARAGGPVALILTDTQFTSRRPLGRDASLEVHVDALEIEDLGEAAVPDNECSLGNEAQQCGEHGVCVLGRCVDGAAVLGTLPREEIRGDYLGRRAFLVDATLAVRQTRSNLAEFRSTLESLGAAPVKKAWTSIVEAWELLRDGHGSPPTNRAFRVQNLGGVCLGPGKADLLENSAEAPVPMVFEEGFGDVQKGDVLTRIDGEPVDDWVEHASRYLYYNGDPRGREALRVNDIFRAAILSGSTVEFERCTRAEDNRETPCSSDEVETISIDFASEVGDRMWDGESADEFFGSRGFCDFRFDGLRPDSNLPQRAAIYFDETEDGIVRGEYYNMPQARRGGGGPFDAWSSAWENALSEQPEQVVVDQRLGFGGSLTATHYLGDMFLKDDNAVREAAFPWYGVELSDEAMEGLEQCYSSEGGSRGCGGLLLEEVQAQNNPNLGVDSKLAVLSARSVSGHDFWAKYITFRDSDTRFFGYSPTIGAFGVARQFPPLGGELRPPGYQLHDTRFYNGDGSLFTSEFVSGIGVGPDEVVYQHQSDALAGIDTIVEAAKAWLRSSN